MKELTLDPGDLTWLTQLARGLLRDSAAADDLVQETMMVALERTPPEGSGRRPWLGGVARRLALRSWRGDRRRRRWETEAARSEALPDSAELVERTEFIDELTSLLRGLPEPYRRTLLLHYLEGHTSEVIARREDLAIDSIRWRIRRGHELLREQLERRHGSSWSALLLPLCRFDSPTAQVAGIGAPGGSLPLLNSLVLSMKTTFWIAALCSTGLWIAWSAAGPREATVALDAPRQAGPLERESLTTSPLELAAIRSEIGVQEDANEATLSEDPARPAWRGRLVDESGQPVPDARVFLRLQSEADKAAPGPWATEAAAISDAEGRLSLRPAALQEEDTTAPLFELGIAATGYLDQKRANMDLRPRDDEQLIVLTRGAWLVGVVVDTAGRPIPDIEIVAHTDGAAIEHVSLSSSLRRVGRATLSGNFQSCLATTDENGEIRLSGLPSEEVLLRSLSPDWYLRAAAFAGGPYQVWTAIPVTGVRVDVQDARTGSVAQDLNATFNMRITMNDGTEVPYGKWVGRGNGFVSYSLLPEHAPDLDLSQLATVQFHGTVTYGEHTKKWEAPIIEGPTGLAKVELSIDPMLSMDLDNPAAIAEAPEPDWPTCNLQLDVRRESGAPVEQVLVLEWQTVRERKVKQGELDLPVNINGRHRVEVPAGEITLWVREWGSSGSMQPTAVTLNCDPGEQRLVSMVLPGGASITLVRPKEWKGPWSVRAQRRDSEDEEWFGAWGYGTDEEDLILRALKPGQWKFELRPETVTVLGQSEPDEDVMELRVVDVAAGEHPRITE